MGRKATWLWREESFVLTLRGLLGTVSTLGLLLVLGGCGATSPGSGAAPWNGAAAWKDLVKLGNYSYASSALEGYNFQAQEIVQSGSYADSSAYVLTLHGVSATQSWLGISRLIRTGGQYYGHVAYPTPKSGLKVGWYDLGSSMSTAYSYTLTEYSLLSGLWTNRLGKSTASYTGGCSVAGRSGFGYTVHFKLNPGIGRRSANGTACVDEKTGALLKADFVLHATDPTGAPVVFQDHFSVISVGDIAAPSVPAGSKPAPKVAISP